jgi:hypothetical protein
MSEIRNSAHELIEQIKRKAPEFLDLLTAHTDSDFERAFDALLEKAVAHLEKNKMNFNKLGEVGLTAVLVASLSIPGLSVSQETHSNGHVDLTVEADHSMPARRKLGEAKIYSGPSYHVAGLQQLLGRYTTGREGRGLLIVYFRKEDIAGLVKKLRQVMDASLPCHQKGKTEDHVLQWSFLSTHTHSSGEVLKVGHVGCNLYIG